MRALALGTLCSALAAAPAAAAAGGSAADLEKPLLRYPRTSVTDLGTARLFAQNDDTATLSGLQMFVGGGLADQPAGENGIAALTAAAVLLTPIDGTPLRDAVSDAGGSLTFSVDVSHVRFYLEGRSSAFPALMMLLGKALAAPDFSVATLRAARAEIGTRIAEQSRNPIMVGLGMFRQSLYVDGAGYPIYGTAASVAALDGGEVRKFFEATYRRGSVGISAVGRVTAEISAATHGLVASLPDGTAPAAPVRTHALPAQPRRIITYRDVGVPWLVMGFRAPAPGERDFAAMLVVQSLLSSVFERPSAITLPAIERGIGALYLYETKPSSFAIFVNGGEIAPTLALREILVVTKALAAEPLKPDGLSLYKRSAEGAFVTDSMTMNDRSWLIGNFALQGVGPDYANTALEAVTKVTAADVQRVAKRYLQNYTVAIVLPRERGGGPSKP